MSIPESHLAQEAIAALVDGELGAGPAGRAARHLSGCAQCRMAVQAQREAKDALHSCADVTVPGDLIDRLRAIPFTAEIPGGTPGGMSGGGGLGTVTVGRDQLTFGGGAGGSWSVALQPHDHPDGHPHDHPHQGHHHSRWLRRGVIGTVGGLSVGIVALTLSLSPGGQGGSPHRPVAGSPGPQEHTGVVPPVVRTVTVGTTSQLPAVSSNQTP